MQTRPPRRPKPSRKARRSLVRPVRLCCPCCRRAAGLQQDAAGLYTCGLCDQEFTVERSRAVWEPPTTGLADPDLRYWGFLSAYRAQLQAEAAERARQAAERRALAAERAAIAMGHRPPAALPG